jgi:dTDP-4-dehydrorhamnose 3,5-epimerase-like enzyme
MTSLDDVLFFKLKKVIESNGILIPIEFDNSLLFKPKRTFFVTNVPDKNTRGMHSHYETKQLLICLNGRIDIKLHDGFNEKVYELYNGDSLYVPNLIWDEQVYYTKETVLISLCNTNYNIKDYIQDFNAFLKIKQNK